MHLLRSVHSTERTHAGYRSTWAAPVPPTCAVALWDSVPCWCPRRLALDRRCTPGKAQLLSSCESLQICHCDDRSTTHGAAPELAQHDKKLLSYKHSAVLWLVWVALRQDVCCLVQAVRLHTKLKEEPWDCAGHGLSSQDSWNNNNNDIYMCACVGGTWKYVMLYHRILLQNVVWMWLLRSKVVWDFSRMDVTGTCLPAWALTCSSQQRKSVWSSVPKLLHNKPQNPYLAAQVCSGDTPVLTFISTVEIY